MVLIPVLIGSGSSGNAIRKALGVVSFHHPDWPLGPVVSVSRGESLDGIFRSLPSGGEPLLLVANPHGLHTRLLLEAERAGFRHALVEKPACVSLEEAKLLSACRVSTGIFHGYRQMWGPGRIRELLKSGEMGDWFSIEGAYWQSSAASADKKALGWKDDPKLGGGHDVLIDLACHWTDLAFFLAGMPAEKARVWKGYVNAASPHRDTHVHLALQFPGDRRGFASVSKTAHGEGNHLEVRVFGSRGSASWRFATPDEIELSRGGERHVIRRGTRELTPSRSAPFHGMGWLEGYAGVLEAKLGEIFEGAVPEYPTLAQHLAVMNTLLAADNF